MNKRNEIFINFHKLLRHEISTIAYMMHEYYSVVGVWLHFSNRFICKGLDIGIYLILTGGWI